MADALMAARTLTAAARTDAGRVRTNNEDLPVLDAERGIFGVIDGVGGHAGGEKAAAIARDVILQRLARPLGTPGERVREAIAIANNEIFRHAASSPELAGMTCVVTLAVVAEGRLTVGHVGDSRLYKLRPSGLVKLTHDHSPVGEREDAREIGELEAMRHPRRHEVFRDVGSALRDKDEPDYVEVIEDTLEDDAAILICSDGLTDMVPSAVIDRVVRTHAGDAEAVVVALVDAANEAGGRDNVTVVYAEGPAFAAGLASDRSMTAVSTPDPVREQGHGLLGRVTRSRSTWFVLGAVLGLAAALLLAWRLSSASVVGGRTLVAAPQASETVGTLAAAVQEARSGDVIRLEPGTYAESLVVPDGVSLRARVPGAAVFVRPPAATGDWVAIIAGGSNGGTIAGVRVVSTTEAPVQIGIRLRGQGHTLELLQVDGATRAGVELLPDATATLHGGHFAVPDAAITLAAGSRLEATGNVFVYGGAPAAATAPVSSVRGRSASRRPVPPVTDVAAISVALDAEAVMRRNVFVGFGTMPIRGLPDAERERVRTANVVVSADPSTSGRPAGER